MANMLHAVQPDTAAQEDIMPDANTNTVIDFTKVQEPRWVRVSRLGNQYQEFDWTDGFTVGQALAAANLKVGRNEKVQVNGVRVEDLDQVLESNSAVQVTTAVTNG